MLAFSLAAVARLAKVMPFNCETEFERTAIWGASRHFAKVDDATHQDIRHISPDYACIAKVVRVPAPLATMAIGGRAGVAQG